MTTPIRTVIDLAVRIHDPLLGIIVDEGSIARLWTPESIQKRLDALPHSTPGRGELARVLEVRLGEGHLDSRLEQRIVRVLRRAYPGFRVHHRVSLDGHTFELDMAWVTEKIDGEIDGLATRMRSRSKFEQSSVRENVLIRNGWRIVHFTHGMDDATILAQLDPYFQR